MYRSFELIVIDFDAVKYFLPFEKGINSFLHIIKVTIDDLERQLLTLKDSAIVGPQGSFLNFETAKDIISFNKGLFDNPVEVDAVSGSLFAVKTELLNSGVLKFDNQYTPCYFEE